MPGHKIVMMVSRGLHMLNFINQSRGGITLSIKLAEDRLFIIGGQVEINWQHGINELVLQLEKLGKLIYERDKTNDPFDCSVVRDQLLLGQEDFKLIMTR
jgi:hypothetical protein